MRGDSNVLGAQHLLLADLLGLLLGGSLTDVAELRSESAPGLAGSMKPTLMPLGASSRRIASEKPAMPAFMPAYTLPPAPSRCAETDPIRMMSP